MPKARFRLFVAADTTGSTPEAISEFAHAALKRGMVYFCAWGPGCKRFHDVVDEVRDKRLIVGPTTNDVVMTTWHEKETLHDALDYFLISAWPTDGFAVDSDYWVAMCINNPLWAAIVRQRLEGLDPSRLM